jgi:putative membrane protein insertion efficiency factor
MSRRLRLAIVLALSAIVLWDLTRPPARQWSAAAAVAAIHLYQATLSPRLAATGLACRFTPTCSHYAEVVIARDGMLVGTWKAAWRVMRCGPWTPLGTVDRP